MNEFRFYAYLVQVGLFETLDIIYLCKLSIVSNDIRESARRVYLLSPYKNDN